MRSLVGSLSIHSIWFICFLIMSSFSVQNYAASTINQEALKVVADFADRICDDIPLEGTGSSLELSGNAKAELNGLVKKIAELGIEGAAKYESKDYQGLLQKDLALALNSSRTCKLEVFKSLKDGLLTTESNYKNKGFGQGAENMPVSREARCKMPNLCSATIKGERAIKLGVVHRTRNHADCCIDVFGGDIVKILEEKPSAGGHWVNICFKRDEKFIYGWILEEFLEKQC